MSRIELVFSEPWRCVWQAWGCTRCVPLAGGGSGAGVTCSYDPRIGYTCAVTAYNGAGQTPYHRRAQLFLNVNITVLMFRITVCQIKVMQLWITSIEHFVSRVLVASFGSCVLCLWNRSFQYCGLFTFEKLAWDVGQRPLWTHPHTG